MSNLAAQHEIDNSLFSELMNLCTNCDSFFFADHWFNNTIYRIFNYRLASYSDFLLPSAMECRGTMFQISDGAGGRLAPPQLVCRPMQKFFNLNENPLTMDLDLSCDNIESIQMKADGSLISTYLDAQGGLNVKSKGSLQSEQAVNALSYIKKLTSQGDDFEKELTTLSHEFTVNMEYVAPTNRIVLQYQNEDLIVLNIRNKITGDYVDISDNEFASNYPCTYHRITPDATSQYPTLTVDDLIAGAKHLDNIEGFVVRLKNGIWFKLKTDWYISLHRNKDSVDNPRRLFEAVLNETTDDLRAMFSDNPDVISKINNMEHFTHKLYNDIVREVECFASTYMDLISKDDRRAFAVTASTTLEPHIMSLVMMKYDFIRGTKLDVDYKSYILKQWKRWGLKDEKIVNDDVGDQQ